MKQIEPVLGTTYKQTGFDYFLVIKKIIKTRDGKRLSEPIILMAYKGVDKPDFETNIEHLSKAVYLERWIPVN